METERDDIEVEMIMMEWDDHDGMRWVWLMMIKYYGNDPVNSRTETGNAAFYIVFPEGKD